MKLALAIVCSLLLAGAPLWAARAPMPAVCAKQFRACCKHGVMPCCAAKPAPDSQPAPAAPAPAGIQSQLSLLAPAILIWTLPANPVDSIASTFTPFSTASGAPLFARHCARLL
jgi:hypothetical protein